MLAHALAYASRGWRVMPLHGIENGICTCRPSPTRPKAGAECPSPGKHPRIKTGRGFAAATTDRAQIEAWWQKWPQANIGIATGSRSNLVVIDLDGEQGFATLKALLPAAGGHPPSQSLPDTLIAVSGREGIGVHLYYSCSDISPTNSGHGLDIRGDGGLVVAPPSMHVSGRPYSWVNASEPAAMPGWLLQWGFSRDGQNRDKTGQGYLIGRPAYLQRSAAPDLVSIARKALGSETELADVESALAIIPNADLGWDAWNRVGMAIWAATDGSEEGLDLFDDWSAKSRKYDPAGPEERWRAYAGSPPDSLSFGSLHYLAKQTDPAWEPPSQARREAVPPDQLHTGTLSAVATPAAAFQNTNGFHGPIPGTQLAFSAPPGNPLIELNQKHCVIGNLGGKCLVMEWIDSPADKTVKIPSFQTFNAFSERYANRHMLVVSENSKGDKVERYEPIGKQWLKWVARRTFEAIDLDPTGGPLLNGNTLNLWTGFGVTAAPGEWPRMQEHICTVLADGDTAAASYIIRWAAWTVQHASERPETALVFRGGKGIGKGSFGHAMRRLFGQHGLHISNSKHLVGQFNGHLRNTILLLADEAFWAGDKQGESTLKALLTEPTIMVENKGVDATPWRNRLHVIMLANAEWVVPATADERRYAVFNVNEGRARNRTYFDKLHTELENGGLAAMLWDLQRLDLKGWHPRDVLETGALREQKAHSFGPLDEWFESLLQSGYLPMMDNEGRVPAFGLFNSAREMVPRLRDVSVQAVGRYLKKRGGIAFHTGRGQVWRFPALKDMREMWARRYSGWQFDDTVNEWQHK